MTSDQTGRYVTLQGHPLHEPLWKTFHQSAAGQAAAAAVAIAAGCDVALTGGQHVIGEAMWSLTGSVINTALIHTFLQWRLKEQFGDVSRYAVDTKPDCKTPPTSSKNLTRSVQAMTTHAVYFAGFSIYDLIFRTPAWIAAAGEGKARFLNEVSQDLAFMLPAYAIAFSGFRRFKKVMDLEYAIVDPPPAQKAAEKESALSAAPLPAPLKA